MVFYEGFTMWQALWKHRGITRSTPHDSPGPEGAGILKEEDNL